MLNNQPIKGEVHLGKQTIGKMYYNHELVYENMLASGTVLWEGRIVNATVLNLPQLAKVKKGVRVAYGIFKGEWYSYTKDIKIGEFSNKIKPTDGRFNLIVSKDTFKVIRIKKGAGFRITKITAL